MEIAHGENMYSAEGARRLGRLRVHSSQGPSKASVHVPHLAAGSAHAATAGRRHALRHARLALPHTRIVAARLAHLHRRGRHMCVRAPVRWHGTHRADPKNEDAACWPLRVHHLAAALALAHLRGYVRCGVATAREQLPLGPPERRARVRGVIRGGGAARFAEPAAASARVDGFRVVDRC